MIDWLVSLVACLSFFQIGLVVDYYILRKKLEFDLAKFWGLGLGFVAILQMFMAVFRVSTSRELVLIVTALAFLPLIFDKKLRSGLGKNIAVDVKSWPFVALLFLLTFSQAIWGHDAFAFWLSRGRAFFIDGGVTRGNLYFYWPFDQPILWPAVVAWFYALTGLVNNYFIRIIPFVTFLLVGFRLRSWFWRTVLLLTPFMLWTLILPEHAGNADFLVGFFVFLAAGYLWEGSFGYTGIFLGLAALTKNEALPMLLAFPLLVLLLLARERGFKDGVVAAVGFLLFSFGFKLFFGLGSRYLGQSLSGILASRPIGKYMVYTAQAFREEWRQVYRWGLGWWVSFFVVIVNWKKIVGNRRLIVLVLLLVAYFLSLFWVYYVTPENQATQIATSLSRVLVEIYPTMILVCSLLTTVHRRAREVYPGE